MELCGGQANAFRICSLDKYFCLVEISNCVVPKYHCGLRVQQEGHSVGAAAREFRTVQQVFRHTWEVLHTALKAWEESRLMPIGDVSVQDADVGQTGSTTASFLLGE
jgi:hypothetical protein